MEGWIYIKITGPDTVIDGCPQGYVQMLIRMELPRTMRYVK